MQIVDATDPLQPKLLSTWQIQRALGINPGLGVWPRPYCYSVSASADGNLAYLSYLDAGAVILDISDPARPQYLGRTVYPVTEEGETQSAVEADDGRLLVTTDEDIDPTPAANTIRVTQPAIELAITRQLAKTGPVRGEVVYVGSALPGIDLKADPKGKIALLDPGTKHQRGNQVRRLQEAGAVAVLFSEIVYRLELPISAITIPGVSLRPDLAKPLKETLEKGERVEVELTAGPATWGFVRLWDIRDRANPVEVGTCKTPETTRFPPRQPDSWFTAHKPFVRGDRLYVSWYRDGVRVLDIRDPARPKEIAHYVPPGTPFVEVEDVVEHNGLILMTAARWRRNPTQSGLWIVRDLPR